MVTSCKFSAGMILAVLMTEVAHSASAQEAVKHLRGLAQIVSSDFCATANNFCNVLSKGSVCVVNDHSDNRGICSNTTIPCHCVGVTDYNQPQTSTTSSTSTSATATALPVTTTSFPGDSGNNGDNGCGPDYPLKSVELTLWTEWPSLTDSASTDKYFQDILTYLSGNCANIRTTKLILRVINPSLSLYGSSTALQPSLDSPLYTKLISKLPSTVQLHFYPYLMGLKNQTAWEQYGQVTGDENLLNSVYRFANAWNKVLSSAGAPTVQGVVIDNEEIRSLPNYDAILDLFTISTVKGDLEFGITIGFDETPRLNTMAPNVDKFYLQVYDLYTPTPDIARTSNSPFLTMQNDAVSMANFIVNEALTSQIWETYNKWSGKIALMWSVQSLRNDCLYPLVGGTCGVNNEFGSWTGQGFNNFITAFNAAIPDKGVTFEHALFQFNFVPNNWMPA